MSDAADPSFCFVHAADLHLDTPFKGLHEAAPEVAAALREASLDAFDAIVALALERDAAFLLVAGDVYDGAERGLRAQLRFRDGLARLADAGIASFVVHGNHDPLGSGWSAIATWPELVTIFGSDAVEVAGVERDGALIATVQGISYATVETTENLAISYTRPEGPGVHIGLLHCNVAGAADGYADYSPCTLEDLRRTRLDYLALGHIHQRAVLAAGQGPGDPWIVYPGNSQARSPKPSERGPKGAYVVHVRDGRIDEPEFVACDQVRFEELECPIGDLGDLGDLEDRLGELADETLGASDGRSVVLRCRITGRGGLHGDLTRAGSLDELLAHLRAAQRPGPRFCWWDELRDETAPVIDRDELRGRGDFASDLLACAEDLARDHSAREALANELVGALPRILTRDVAGLLDDEHLEAMIDAATTLALDELALEEP